MVGSSDWDSGKESRNWWGKRVRGRKDGLAVEKGMERGIRERTDVCSGRRSSKKHMLVTLSLHP